MNHKQTETTLTVITLFMLAVSILLIVYVIAI
jgi:hypothetical protein